MKKSSYFNVSLCGYSHRNNFPIRMLFFEEVWTKNTILEMNITPESHSKRMSNFFGANGDSLLGSPLSVNLIVEITINVDVRLVSKNNVSVKVRIEKESFFEFDCCNESLGF